LARCFVLWTANVELGVQAFLQAARRWTLPRADLLGAITPHRHDLRRMPLVQAFWCGLSPAASSQFGSTVGRSGWLAAPGTETVEADRPARGAANHERSLMPSRMTDARALPRLLVYAYTLSTKSR
jgi:hypothetical protein